MQAVAIAVDKFIDHAVVVNIFTTRFNDIVYAVIVRVGIKEVGHSVTVGIFCAFN